MPLRIRLRKPQPVKVTRQRRQIGMSKRSQVARQHHIRAAMCRALLGLLLLHLV